MEVNLDTAHRVRLSREANQLTVNQVSRATEVDLSHRSETKLDMEVAHLMAKEAQRQAMAVNSATTVAAHRTSKVDLPRVMVDRHNQDMGEVHLLAIKEDMVAQMAMDIQEHQRQASENQCLCLLMETLQVAEATILHKIQDVHMAVLMAQ